MARSDYTQFEKSVVDFRQWKQTYFPPPSPKSAQTLAGSPIWLVQSLTLALLVLVMRAMLPLGRRRHLLEKGLVLRESKWHEMNRHCRIRSSPSSLAFHYDHISSHGRIVHNLFC